MEPSSLSKEELTKLYDECGGDLALVAEKLGIDPETFSQLITPEPTQPRRRRQPPVDLGQAKLRKYTISIRHADTPGLWPRGDREAIERARRLYELGTHEMVQGRDGEWIIQYLIPRKTPVAPRKFYQEIL